MTAGVVSYSLASVWVNAVFALVAACFAVWASVGASELQRIAKYAKAAVAFVYFAGNLYAALADAAESWSPIGRWLGLIAWPVAWWLPDYVNRRSRDDAVVRVKATVVEAMTKDPL